MLCCVLAGLLALAGFRGRRDPPGTKIGETPEPTTVWAFLRSKLPGTARRPGRVAGFGLFGGALGFEVVAVLATWWHGLDTRRPELMLAATAAFTVLGVAFALAGGAPTCRRAWALFALSFSAGSAVMELLDLHLLRVHTGEDVVATVALHGLAVLGGVVGGRLLLSVNASGEARQFAPARLRRAHTQG
ncbi:MAG TPA: hypothetical protein VHT30_09835 [Acidimicrobiales bacterium]|jgi:hypothetical protein|nr:hypothetical protein [Acidimicrobiales bacterium]